MFFLCNSGSYVVDILRMYNDVHLIITRKTKIKLHSMLVFNKDSPLILCGTCITVSWHILWRKNIYYNRISIIFQLDDAADASPEKGGEMTWMSIRGAVSRWRIVMPRFGLAVLALFLHSQDPDRARKIWATDRVYDSCVSKLREPSLVLILNLDNTNGEGTLSFATGVYVEELVQYRCGQYRLKKVLRILANSSSSFAIFVIISKM